MILKVKGCLVGVRMLAGAVHIRLLGNFAARKVSLLSGFQIFVPQKRAARTLLGFQCRIVHFQLVNELGRFRRVVSAAEYGQKIHLELFSRFVSGPYSVRFYRGTVMQLQFFRKALVIMGLLSLLAGLTACDPQRIAELEEGVATEADVRARFGEPEKIWDASDMAKLPLQGAAATPGARTFEYNRQPAGTVNYMITIGPDGKMSALRQVLNSGNFALILPGMPMETVRKILGKPMKVVPYALQQTTHYDWRYLNPPNVNMIFTVVFDRDLRVVSTGSAQEELVNPIGK